MHPRPAYMKWGAHLGIVIAVGALMYLGIRHTFGSMQANIDCPKQLFAAPPQIS